MDPSGLFYVILFVLFGIILELKSYSQYSPILLNIFFRRIWHLEDEGKKYRNIIKTRSAKGHRAQQINPTSLAYSGDGKSSVYQHKLEKGYNIFGNKQGLVS